MQLKLTTSEITSAEFPWSNFKLSSKNIGKHIKLLKFSQNAKENKTVGFAIVDISGPANVSLLDIVPEFTEVYTTDDFTMGMAEFLLKKTRDQ